MCDIGPEFRVHGACWRPIHLKSVNKSLPVGDCCWPDYILEILSSYEWALKVVCVCLGKSVHEYQKE